MGDICSWSGADGDLCVDCRVAETADAGDPDAPLYALVHIPKAAGSTIRAVALRQYPKPGHLFMLPKTFPLDAVTALSPAAEARLRILIEVPHLGLHHLLRRPVRYVTMLRHPVERVISYYFYRKNKRKGFESVARQRDNTQTRILAGMVPYAGPSTRVTRSALDDAKANLRDHVALPMLSERFDESLILARRHLGWDRILYRPLNVTPRPAGSAISEHFRRRIEGDNQYDLELYAYAQALFERAVAAQDPSFAIEFEAFRRLNATNQRSKIDGAPARSASVTFASQAPRLLAEYASEQPDGANGRSYREFRAHLLEFCTAWDARHSPPQLGPWNDAASPQERPAVSA